MAMVFLGFGGRPLLAPVPVPVPVPVPATLDFCDRFVDRALRLWILRQKPYATPLRKRDESDSLEEDSSESCDESVVSPSSSVIDANLLRGVTTSFRRRAKVLKNGPPLGRSLSAPVPRSDFT